MKAVAFSFGIFLALVAAAPALAADAAPQKASTVNLPQIRGLLAGTWQSIDDPGFTRELRIDGTAIDRYEGDDSATGAGQWLVFAGTALPPDLAARKLPADGVYLQVRTHGDIYLFALISLDPQSLQMISVDRNKQVSYARLK